MLLLSIDTCGPLGSVALARLEDDALTLLGQTELPGKSYSAQLLPALRALLAAHPASSADLAAIIVTSGPGSFTGIRIGIATAKGLAEVHSIPLLAVSRLAVLAHKAGTPAAALDAGRGEFYFVDGSSSSTRESLLDRDAFHAAARSLAGKLAVCDPAAHKAAPQAVLVPAPTALDALHCALPRLRAEDYDAAVTLDGNYLRRSDAEIFSQPKFAPHPSA